jgi:hypothetical protein
MNLVWRTSLIITPPKPKCQTVLQYLNIYDFSKPHLTMLNQIFRLEKPVLDPSTGFLICEGIAARTGVQPYNSEEITKEFRRPGVDWYFVYRDAAFIKAFDEKTKTGTVPVANEHSTINVALADETGDDNVVGWVSTSEIIETKDNNAYLKVKVTIKCPKAIERLISDDHVGLSMGYSTTVVALDKVAVWIDTDGVIGAAGLEYPYILQSTDPVVNHLALCTVGRAGEITAVHLDAYIESEINVPDPEIKEQVVQKSELQKDDYKLYRYPTMDENTSKMLKDAITSALSDMMPKYMGDMMPKVMGDAFKSQECKDALYQAFTAMDLASAIRSMYEKDKPADNAADVSNQEQIKSVAYEKGFQNDGFGSAVIDSIKVWREVGAELVDSANEAMTADQLKTVWLKGKGVEVTDSMTPETINSLYAAVRKIAMTAPTNDSAPASAMKSLFDSFQAPAAATVNPQIRVVQDSFGGAVYY